MINKILITGGSGLVGKTLSELFIQKGFEVRVLSRSLKNKNNVNYYKWDVEKGKLDEKAFDGVQTIIHLAGAGVMDKKWSKRRKNEILKSRTESTKLLFYFLKNNKHQVSTFISASAIGFYGIDLQESWVTEQTPPGSDFLSIVTQQWEEEVKKIELLNIRTVILRIGIVFSSKGGALEALKRPIKLGFGSMLGNGFQQMSWIHIFDLCEMFCYALITKNLKGTFNAVSPHPESNQTIVKKIAEILGRPLFLPKVPSFVIKIMLGERANLVLQGIRVSSQKISEKGFEFRYPTLHAALVNLLKVKK